MPKTTEDQVREVGGLNDRSDTGDWLLFRFNDDGELSAAIANAMAAASSWVVVRIEASVYASTDSDINTLLALGEAYLTLHFLVPALKARKVFGSHYAVEAEDSDRFAALIDVEWLNLARELLEPWLIVPGTTSAYAKPRMRIGTVINPLDPGFETIETEFEETLDRARSLTLPSI